MDRRTKAATKNMIKWECSSQMLSLLLQKQRRHVKQQTQAWHRARHSEVTVAMLIGPPETLRSCSPMLGETTPKNHSAVKKVVPKTGTLLSRGNRRIRGNCFQCFRRVRETIARGVRLHLIRVVPIVAMCDSGVLFNTQGAQHTNTANTEHTQSKHTHTHTQTHRPTQSKHTHRHAHRDPQNSFTKPRLHKAQAHTHTY